MAQNTSIELFVTVFLTAVVSSVIVVPFTTIAAFETPISLLELRIHSGRRHVLSDERHFRVF